MKYKFNKSRKQRLRDCNT